MVDWLKIRLIEIVAWFLQLAKDSFAAIWDVIKDAFCWILEQLLTLAVSAANSLDLSGLQTYITAWGDLPGDIINVMGLLGAGEAAGIISSAVIIRLILQLIPFTRLGS